MNRRLFFLRPEIKQFITAHFIASFAFWAATEAFGLYSRGWHFLYHDHHLFTFLAAPILPPAIVAALVVECYQGRLRLDWHYGHGFLQEFVVAVLVYFDVRIEVPIRRRILRARVDLC